MSTFDDDFLTNTPEIRSMMGVMLLYWRLEECFREGDEAGDLSKQERHLLVKLDQPMRMGVLAEKMLQSPSSITASADALESKGYLTRSRDPDDRRAWLLSLTSLGQETRAETIADAGTLFREVSGLSEEEINSFADLATRIGKRILQTGVPEGMDL